MSIGRNIMSANTLLRSYARRPGSVGSALGAYAGRGTVGVGAGAYGAAGASEGARQPLNRFLQTQSRLAEDTESSPQNTPLVMSYDRPRMPPPSPSMQAGYNSPYRDTSQQRMTTGMDYRPFSEPVPRQPEYYEEEY
jgi:hypothetical protein